MYSRYQGTPKNSPGEREMIRPFSGPFFMQWVTSTTTTSWRSSQIAASCEQNHFILFHFVRIKKKCGPYTINSQVLDKIEKGNLSSFLHQHPSKPTKKYVSFREKTRLTLWRVDTVLPYKSRDDDVTHTSPGFHHRGCAVPCAVWRCAPCFCGADYFHACDDRRFYGRRSIRSHFLRL